jgi:biopolymer transport protein ExbB
MMDADLWEFLASGGPIMLPIAICSFVALTALLERLFVLRLQSLCPDSFLAELHELLRQIRPLDALALCKKDSSSIAAVFEVLLENRDLPRESQKERAEEVGRQILSSLEQRCLPIGIVASIAPMLGLLGTVWGMILTFAVIQNEGMGSIAGLAGGVSQALITTWAGLSVGIPALVAHRWLLARVDMISLRFENEAIKLIDVLVAEEAAPDSVEEG